MLCNCSLVKAKQWIDIGGQTVWLDTKLQGINLIQKGCCMVMIRMYMNKHPTKVDYSFKKGETKLLRLSGRYQGNIWCIVGGKIKTSLSKNYTEQIAMIGQRESRESGYWYSYVYFIGIEIMCVWTMYTTTEKTKEHCNLNFSLMTSYGRALDCFSEASFSSTGSQITSSHQSFQSTAWNKKNWGKRSHSSLILPKRIVVKVLVMQEDRIS